jgi:hypothetical protein
VEHKTRIKVHDLGPTRWHMSIWFRHPYNGQFEEWMKDNYPDCLCRYCFNYGDRPYYELRGGDPDDQTMIAMRWAE